MLEVLIAETEQRRTGGQPEPVSAEAARSIGRLAEWLAGIRRA
jgi:hypothetical protein